MKALRLFLESFESTRSPTTNTLKLTISQLHIDCAQQIHSEIFFHLTQILNPADLVNTNDIEFEHDKAKSIIKIIFAFYRKDGRYQYDFGIKYSSENVARNVHSPYQPSQIATKIDFKVIMENIKVKPENLSGITKNNSSALLPPPKPLFRETYVEPSINLPIVQKQQSQPLRVRIRKPQESFRKVVHIKNMQDLEQARTNSSITRIYIHPKLKIPDGAFCDRTNLTNISISEGVQIGIGAFSGCTGLIEIHISPDVMIGMAAFSHCTGLTQIASPPDVTIGMGAFSHCTGLMQIAIPPGVPIGIAAFFNCKSISSEFYRDRYSKYTHIKNEQDLERARNDSSITSIYIHPKLKIPTNAFYYHKNLIKIFISEGVQIGDSAFSSCPGLIELHISPNVTIGMHAFSYCTGLTMIATPPGVTIETYAFSECTGLKTILILHGTKMPNSSGYPAASCGPFWGCTKLEHVHVVCSTKVEQRAWQSDYKQNKFHVGERTDGHKLKFTFGKPGGYKQGNDYYQEGLLPSRYAIP